MNIFLIGYRCTGKTTVGKALARRLGWPFVDTDRIVAATAGTSIARMVDEKGWAYFREQERQTLKALSADDRLVVATGGGVILDKCNVSAMRKSGTVVLLTASHKTIAARMLADDATEGSRPSLTGQGLVREITSVLGERLPLYEMASDFAIDTNRKTIEAICDRIIEKAGLKPEDG